MVSMTDRAVAASAIFKLEPGIRHFHVICTSEFLLVGALMQNRSSVPANEKEKQEQRSTILVIDLSFSTFAGSEFVKSASLQANNPPFVSQISIAI